MYQKVNMTVGNKDASIQSPSDREEQSLASSTPFIGTVAWKDFQNVSSSICKKPYP
jgi:hypothetical protein